MNTPTLETKFGKAYRYDIDAMARKANRKDHGSLDSWLIFVPWANIAWHSYVIHLMHLRPYPEFVPVLRLAGATHEIVVAAVDPDWKLNLNQSPRMLHPMNFAGQWIDADAGARAKAEQCVKDILDGRLSPDTDYSQHWIARFGSALIKGDPKRVGETRLTMGGEEIVIDPKGLENFPNDKLCPVCGLPIICAGPFGDFCANCRRNQ